jgi:hypothetical protein
MPTNPTNARDEIFRHFTDNFDASAIVDPVVIRYQGFERGEVPKKYWVRLSSQQVTSPQSAHIMTDEPGASPVAYDTNGLVFVQVFAPMSEEDSYRKGELIATLARDIFRAVETPSGVWFRNARFNELDPDGKHYRWNVKVEYQFSERKG